MLYVSEDTQAPLANGSHKGENIVLNHGYYQHTKFRENRPADQEKIFECFLPYMGVVAILVM